MRDWLINIRGKTTQQTVANRCGISQNFYSWIEQGKRTPSVDVAKRIAAVLGFEWARFYEDDQAGDEAV